MLRKLTRKFKYCLVYFWFDHTLMTLPVRWVKDDYYEVGSIVNAKYNPSLPEEKAKILKLDDDRSELEEIILKGNIDLDEIQKEHPEWFQEEHRTYTDDELLKLFHCKERVRPKLKEKNEKKKEMKRKAHKSIQEDKQEETKKQRTYCKNPEKNSVVKKLASTVGEVTPTETNTTLFAEKSRKENNTPDNFEARTVIEATFSETKNVLINEEITNNHCNDNNTESESTTAKLFSSSLFCKAIDNFTHQIQMATTPETNPKDIVEIPQSIDFINSSNSSFEVSPILHKAFQTPVTPNERNYTFHEMERPITDMEITIMKMSEKVNELQQRVEKLENMLNNKESPKPQHREDRYENALKQRPLQRNAEKENIRPVQDCTEMFLDYKTISTIRHQSTSMGNFAHKLANVLFTQDERINRNTSGQKGKGQLDPEKVLFIRNTIFENFPTPEHEKRKVWNNCKNAINEGGRRLTRQ